MKIKKKKWITYTLGIGLVPFILRLLLFLASGNKPIAAFSISDLTFFGLILCVSIINESELVDDNSDNWKTYINGATIFLLILFSALCALALIKEIDMELFNQNILIIASGVLCLPAIGLSLFIYNKIE